MKLAMDNYSSDTPRNNSFISTKRNRDDDDVYAYSNYHQCNLIDNNQCIMLENKIYENTNMPFLFFSGTSRFEFKPHYFNFPFRFSHTHVESKDNILEFSISANGFLYNMVRILAGTALEVSSGRLNVNCAEQVFNTGDRALAGPTLPPQGLFLNKLFY